MASAAATWSPSSPQLRLALNCRNCRKSPSILVRTRVGKLGRQIRVLRVAPGGNGTERRRNGDSWIRSDTKVDTFAGWSESEDGGGKSIESQRKKWFQGIVGAGVTGIVLVAGLTFVTLSLTKRNSSRPKQQMEPLTTQQETLLTSDNQNDKVEEKKNEDNNAKHVDCNLETKTGIDMGFTSSRESNEASSEPGLDVDSDVAINNTSIREDLQYNLAFDGMPVALQTIRSLPESPESEIVGGSFVDSSFEDSDGSIAASTLEKASELKENLINVEPTNLSIPNANPTNLYTDQQDEMPGSIEENSNVPLDYSSTPIVHTPNDPIAVSVSTSSELEPTLEPQVVPKDDIDNVISSSIKEKLDLSKKPHVSVEGNGSSSEVHNLNEIRSRGTMPISVSPYPFTNEQDTDNHNEMNRNISLFELPKPGNTFSSAGIPAPSVVSAALQVLPGKVLVPSVVDQVQGQALSALQALKVIESDVQPSDLCTRREYARWLVSASGALSRNSILKVYPAMCIENVTELAYDDITPEDPDFASIQGLAEAGLISSKLSRSDMLASSDEDQSPLYFCPESPLSRQDLVSWKMALEKRQLPEADRKSLFQLSGFLDIDKINPDACPALVADISAGEQGIIALAFGYTRLFQPDKPVTKAQAAIALATGEASDVVSEELARIEAESMAENVVAAHSALVAQVEKDINANFEKELSIEREKIDAVEKMAEEARCELERLKAEREVDNIALMKERAAVESEMEVLSRLRHEVEEKLQSLLSNKVEVSYEKERISKLQKEIENENNEISRLQYELEVERKALSIARAWAEDEAKSAREQAKALEEARERWERHGIKVVVDSDLQEEANAGVTWLNAGKQSVEGTVSRAENLVDKLKVMAGDVKGKSKEIIDKIILKILFLISTLKECATKAGTRVNDLKNISISKAKESAQELQQSSAEFRLAVKEGAKRVAGDCREGVEKLTQKFKT